jgi:hypothetical protein
MSHKLPKSISGKLETLMRDGVEMAGTFAPSNVMIYIEEKLTLAQFIQAEAFLLWVVAKGKTFGRNLPEVYQEFVADDGQAHFDKNIERHGYKQNEPLTFNISAIDISKITVTEFKPR